MLCILLYTAKDASISNAAAEKAVNSFKSTVTPASLASISFLHKYRQQGISAVRLGYYCRIYHNGIPVQKSKDLKYGVAQSKAAPESGTALLFATQAQEVWSSTSADGALALTDSMPFSIPQLLSYISLVPMICPLDALRLKYHFPFDEFFLSNRLDYPTF